MVNPLDASGKPTQAKVVKWKSVRSSFDQKGLPASATIDGNKKSSWAVDPQFGKDHAAVYEVDGALNLPHGADWTFTLDFNGNNKHNLAKIRLAISSVENPAINGAAIPENTSTALIRLKSGEKLQPGQMLELANWYKTRDEDWKKLNQAVEDVLATQPKASLAPAYPGGGFLRPRAFIEARRPEPESLCGNTGIPRGSHEIQGWGETLANHAAQGFQAFLPQAQHGRMDYRYRTGCRHAACAGDCKQGLALSLWQRHRGDPQ
jgi:hypothetical protein